MAVPTVEVPQLSEAEQEAVLKDFQKADVNKDGTLSFAEFKEALKGKVKVIVCWGKSA